MGLTNKQQIFVSEYLQCWNATKAALLAGYSEKTAYSQGQRMLKNVEVSAVIQARISEKAMSADEVLIRLAEQARGDMGEFVEFKDGIKQPYFDLKGAYDKGLFRLVKKLKYDSEGRIEFELYDAQAALQLLGKHHRIFNDQPEGDQTTARLQTWFNIVYNVNQNDTKPMADDSTEATDV